MTPGRDGLWRCDVTVMRSTATARATSAPAGLKQ